MVLGQSSRDGVWFWEGEMLDEMAPSLIKVELGVRARRVPHSGAGAESPRDGKDRVKCGRDLLRRC